MSRRSLESRLDAAYTGITEVWEASGRRARGLRSRGLEAFRPEELSALVSLLLTAIKRDAATGDERERIYLAIGALLGLGGEIIPREEDLWSRLKAWTAKTNGTRRGHAISALSMVYRLSAGERRRRAGELLAAIPVMRFDATDWLDIMEEPEMYGYSKWRESVAALSMENHWMAERAVQHLSAPEVEAILRGRASEHATDVIVPVLERLAARTTPLSLSPDVWPQFLSHRNPAVRLAAVTALAAIPDCSAADPRPDHGPGVRRPG